MGFWLDVYPNRVDFKSGPGSQSVAINQIASVQLGMMLRMEIVIETTGGQKYKIPCNHKKEARDAIYAAQNAFNSRGQQPQLSVADEIAKLNDLKERGIISQAEFEAKKRQLLGL
jgi:hypothetical protein